MTKRTRRSSRPAHQRIRQYDAEQARAFGERLRVLREAAGLSQRELSFPGCTAAYISRVEKGERYPSVPLMRKLAERLNVTADYLETGVRGLAEILAEALEQETSQPRVEQLIDRLNSETGGILCANFVRDVEPRVEVWFAYGDGVKSAGGGSLGDALLGAVDWAKRVAALREAQEAQETEAEEAAAELARLEALSTVTL